MNLLRIASRVSALPRRMIAPNSASISVERDEEEIELEISGTIEPYTPAKMSGHPDTWYPEEGGEVEITGILFNGVPWTGELTEDEVNKAKEALQEESQEGFFEPDDGPEPDYDGPEYDPGY